MRKLINLIALLIMASSVTWAQDKKSFTLEDLMPGGNNYYNLLPQNLYGLQWWGDVCINADIEEVKTIQPANGKENVLITLQEVNELLANKELGKINHFRNASFPYAEKMMLVNTTSKKVLIDLTKKEKYGVSLSLLKPPTRTGTRKAVHWLIPLTTICL